MSIMKKRHAHRGDHGIMVTAFGYAIKARPGPEIDDKKICVVCTEMVMTMPYLLQSLCPPQ